MKELLAYSKELANETTELHIRIMVFPVEEMLFQSEKNNPPAGSALYETINYRSGNEG